MLPVPSTSLTTGRRGGPTMVRSTVVSSGENTDGVVWVSVAALAPCGVHSSAPSVRLLSVLSRARRSIPTDLTKCSPSDLAGASSSSPPCGPAPWAPARPASFWTSSSPLAASWMARSRRSTSARWCLTCSCSSAVSARAAALAASTIPCAAASAAARCALRFMSSVPFGVGGLKPSAQAGQEGDARVQVADGQHGVAVLGLGPGGLLVLAALRAAGLLSFCVVLFLRVAMGGQHVADRGVRGAQLALVLGREDPASL